MDPAFVLQTFSIYVDTILKADLKQDVWIEYTCFNSSSLSDKITEDSATFRANNPLKNAIRVFQ